MKEYDWITFDCYGTLIDWETGIVSSFQKVATTSGVPFERQQVLALYARYEAEEERVYKSYVDVLNRVTRRICVELGYRTASFDFLAESLPLWRPFPDTNSALQRLAVNYKLGILSNIDNHLFAGTRKYLAVPIEMVVTAEDLSAYKPAFQHFEEARRRIGDGSWIHAAQSYFHDLVPCSKLGIDSAWINRNRELNKDPQNVIPLFTGPNLTAFADWIEEAE